MKINKAGLNLIKQFEGCRLKAYQDIKGIWTIGYGHTGIDVHEGLEIDQEMADMLLETDLSSFEESVTNVITSSLNENQFSSLVSFAYNHGMGKFRTSTLLRLVNEGKFDEASLEFAKWDIHVPGLQRRHEAEKVLFSKC